jgi:transposase InsO family protein
MKLRNNLGILTNRQYSWFMKSVTNSIGFAASDKAKFKFRCIEIYEAYGLKAVLQAFPNISARSIYRWRRTYLQAERKLTALLPLSTRPKQVRQMQVPIDILSFLKLMRSKYPKLSKYKLKPLLDEYANDHNLPLYSASWIGKVINRYQFFFNQGRKPVVKRRNQKQKQRIKRCPKDNEVKLGYLQIDAIVLYYHGKKLCYLNAIELKTRQAFVKRVSSISSQEATAFLQEIMSQVDYSIHTIQSDNGSEFEAIFRKTIKELDIGQFNSYPKQPQTQGYVERFNWTLEDECLYYHLDAFLEDPELLDKEVASWLDWYHNKRPHQGLNYQTPKQVLDYQLQLRRKETHTAKCV